MEHLSDVQEFMSLFCSYILYMIHNSPSLVLFLQTSANC